MLADLGLLYCALFWGLSFPTMKILVGIYPTCWLLFLRFSAGAVMIYIFFHKRIHEHFSGTFKGGAIIGTLLFIAIATQTVGLNYIGGGRSAFISAVYVLLVPLIIWAFRKIFPGWIAIIAACICVMGMYFLTGDDISGAFNIGDLLTFICALVFAVQIIAITHFASGCDPIVLSFTEFVTISILSFITSLIFETKTSLLTFQGLPELLFTISFCTFGCYVMQICAQKYAKPSHASIIMSLESVFGLMSSIIFLGESITLRAAAGCTLIFISVLMSELEPFIMKRG